MPSLSPCRAPGRRPNRWSTALWKRFRFSTPISAGGASSSYRLLRFPLRLLVLGLLAHGQVGLFPALPPGHDDCAVHRPMRLSDETFQRGDMCDHAIHVCGVLLIRRCGQKKKSGLGRSPFPEKTGRSGNRPELRAAGPTGRPHLVACTDLVEGRVRNLVGLNLRCSLNHLRQARQHLRIDVAAIVVRVLFPIPQTDRNRFGAVRGEERNLVLEAILLPKQGQDVLLEGPGKLTAVLAFRWMDTLRAYISRLLGYSDVNLCDYDACLCVLQRLARISTSRPCHHRRRASGASSP